MASKTKYQPLHGWFNLDKPVGLSSSQAVVRIRRAMCAKKVGHGGTLDPLATGVLPIALGEATKTVSYAMDGKKTYHFGIRWGESRTTDDREGEITVVCKHRPSESAILAAIEGFVGIIEQIPPKFSAIKVNGRRAYKLARGGKSVSLRPRHVRIESFKLIKSIASDRANFSVTCGKGTYVRSLARDLAYSLGTVGHIDWLRRTAVGPFTEHSTISLDKIESLGHIAARSNFLLPIETVLDDIPAVALTVEEAQRLRCGQPVTVKAVVSQSPLKDFELGDTICAMSEGKLVALARIDDGAIYPVRVVNL